MTSETEQLNVELVRDAVEALNRDGLEGALRTVDDVCHPEVEWRPLLGGIESRVYHGREGMRQYWRDMFEAFEEVRWTDIDPRPVSDRVVVVLATIALRGRGSGAEVEMTLGTVFELEEGLFTKGTVYRTPAEALEAAEGRMAEQRLAAEEAERAR